MKKKHTLLYAAAFILITFLGVACNKSLSDENGLAEQQSVSLYLTDDPGTFDHVFIDIQSAKVLVDTSVRKPRDRQHCNWDSLGHSDRHRPDSGLVWYDLNIRAGVYDVLKLRNGLDTLFATGTLPKGKIRLIKLTLGTNNSLVKDGVTYPLNVPQNDKFFILLKLKGDEFEEYISGRLRLWLDFDVSRSIIRERNGEFWLKPVMKIFVVKQTAAIAGRVLPKEAKTVVSVFNANDTAYAIPNPEGYFKVRGLKPGTYSVYFNGSNGYKDTTLNNISVNIGKETVIGTITLKN